jgi:hypothetical protein
VPYNTTLSGTTSITVRPSEQRHQRHQRTHTSYHVRILSSPTIETFIKSFPHQVHPAVQGVPTYEALNEVKTLLKANTASVPSNGGGGENGYLSIVISAFVYATINNQPFAIPPNPEHTPSFLLAQQPPSSAKPCANMLNNSANGGNILTYRVPFTSNSSPLFIYAPDRQNHHVRFNNITLRELLAFLFDTYGQITPHDLQRNQQRMLTPWDPSTSFELLINQIKEAQEMADVGNQPFSAPQIINTAYTLVFNIGLYFDECKTWNAKLAANTT